MLLVYASWPQLVALYICIPWSFYTLSYRVVSSPAHCVEEPPRHAPHTPHLRGQLGLRRRAKVCKYKYNLTASVIGMVLSQSYGPTTCLTHSHTNPRHITCELPGYHVNSWSGNKKVPGARGHTYISLPTSSPSSCTYMQGVWPPSMVQYMIQGVGDDRPPSGRLFVGREGPDPRHHCLGG